MHTLFEVSEQNVSVVVLTMKGVINFLKLGMRDDLHVQTLFAGWRQKKKPTVYGSATCRVAEKTGARSTGKTQSFVHRRGGREGLQGRLRQSGVSDCRKLRWVGDSRPSVH